MGTSSFRLMRVGGGYWEVLGGLWLKQVFGLGPYRYLRRSESGAVASMPHVSTRDVIAR